MFGCHHQISTSEAEGIKNVNNLKQLFTKEDSYPQCMAKSGDLLDITTVVAMLLVPSRC